MICTKCGQLNPAGANYCHGCSSVLPKVVLDAEAVTHEKVTERYQQLKEAGEKVLGGTWSVEEYATFLDDISNLLAQKEQEIRDIEIPADALEDFRQEIEIGFSGLELYTNGISTMRQFLTDGDEAHIQQGLELIRDGNEMINEAMRINRENRRKLEEVSTGCSTTL